MKISYIKIDGADFVKIKCEQDDDYFLSSVMGKLKDNGLAGKINTISEMLNGEASVTNGIDNEFRMKAWKEFAKLETGEE